MSYNIHMTIHLDSFDRTYLRTVLHIAKYLEGYVWDYIGPKSIGDEVNAEEKRAPEALLDDIALLQATLPKGDTRRKTVLSALLKAMDTTVRKLAGEPIDYFDEVRRLYGIEPTLRDDEISVSCQRVGDPCETAGVVGVSNTALGWTTCSRCWRRPCALHGREPPL